MKIGIRKPSIKKSLKATTTGKLKRTLKKSIIPSYGKKGMGIINNPKKALYNSIYNKTTISLRELIDFSDSKKKSSNNELTYKEKERLSLKLNNDCTIYKKIICSTTNPKEFVETYLKLLKSLKIMQLYEKEINWIEANPSMMLGEAISVKSKCIKNLIDNIYKEQNNNYKKTYEKLSNHLEIIDEENLKYLNSLK